LIHLCTLKIKLTKVTLEKFEKLYQSETFNYMSVYEHEWTCYSGPTSGPVIQFYWDKIPQTYQECKNKKSDSFSSSFPILKC